MVLLTSIAPHNSSILQEKLQIFTFTLRQRYMPLHGNLWPVHNIFTVIYLQEGQDLSEL